MTALTTTTLHSEEDACAYLLAAGVVGPSLHTRAKCPDLGYRHPYRWSGSNKALALGHDADGVPVVLISNHYPLGRADYSGGPVSELRRSGDPAFAFGRIAFPVEALPVAVQIDFPEYTPGYAENYVLTEDEDRALVILRAMGPLTTNALRLVEGPRRRVLVDALDHLADMGRVVVDHEPGVRTFRLADGLVA